MRFGEVDLFGVYVAPISLMMVGAWLVTIALRRIASRFGLLRYVWHPALFVFAAYFIVLSSWVLIFGPLELAFMTVTFTEIISKRGKMPNDREERPSFEPEIRAPVRRRVQVIPFLITLATVALAGLLGWAMWDVYMEAPWTRDATVRAYVVTMAPEVSGRIVELPVTDNQFVHKGDLLMVVDPTNFAIAARLADAAVDQAKAQAQNAQAQSARRQKLTDLAVSQEEQQTFASNSLSANAAYQQALAKRDQAHVDLKRTRILSPVNGYVTNLQVQLGDFVTVGQKSISLVNADSFWVDAYFEETNLRGILEGDRRHDQIDGPRRSRSWARRERRPRHRCAKRSAGYVRSCLGKSDLHLGPPRAARPGAHPSR